MSRQADNLAADFAKSEVKIPKALEQRHALKIAKPKHEEKLKYSTYLYLPIVLSVILTVYLILITNRQFPEPAFFAILLGIVSLFGSAILLMHRSDIKKMLSKCTEAENMVTDSVTALLHDSVWDHNRNCKTFEETVRLKDSLATPEENEKFFTLMKGLASVMDANSKILAEKVAVYAQLADTRKDIFERFNKAVTSDMLLTNELRDKFADDLERISLNLEAELSAPELHELLACRHELVESSVLGSS